MNCGNVAVCDDLTNDCRLTDRRPAEAIRNADNGGEFAVDVYGKILFNHQWPSAQHAPRRPDGGQTRIGPDNALHCQQSPSRVTAHECRGRSRNPPAAR